jgi:hypothetical protein
MEVNNIIWSPPDNLDGEDLVKEVYRQVTENIQNRTREKWPRSPLNVAVHKMQTRIVEMLVKQADFNINSVDEIKDCQRYLHACFYTGIEKKSTLLCMNFRTPLTVAISRAKNNLEKSMEMIRLLKDLGADINQVNLTTAKKILFRTVLSSLRIIIDRDFCGNANPKRRVFAMFKSSQDYIGQFLWICLKSCSS